MARLSRSIVVILSCSTLCEVMIGGSAKAINNVDDEADESVLCVVVVVDASIDALLASRIFSSVCVVR